MKLMRRSLVMGSLFLIVVPPALIPAPGAGTGNILLQAQGNTPPVVGIGSPANGAAYTPESLVTYSVTVSDKEDGESKYEEIPATEVFMELRYFADPLKAAVFRKPAKLLPGYASFTKGDCFNCHAVRSKLIGPSFAEIATKYKKPSDPDSLARHIIRGSTGIWGTAVMPTHPDLSLKDAVQIVKWMIASGKDPGVDYFRGAEGAFRLHMPASVSPKGFFLLKAVYTDHGTDKNGTGSLTGQDVKMIRLSAAK